MSIFEALGGGTEYDADGEPFDKYPPLDEDVREIRRLYATGRYRQVDLARDFDVSQGEISRIVNKKRRGSVE